jgi:hypothetical protein
MSQVQFITQNRLQDKEHYAMYLVTINSNKRIAHARDPYRFRFQQQIIDVITNFKDPERGYIKYKTEPRDPDPFVQILPTIEVGPNQGRLHCHMVVEVYYNGSITINVEKLSQEFAYAFSKFIASVSYGTQNMLRYLKKSGEFGFFNPKVPIVV